MLAAHLNRKPPENWFRSPCRQNLTSSVHAHIDYRGNYLTGFCSGLRIGQETALALPALFDERIELNRYPATRIFCMKNRGRVSMIGDASPFSVGTPPFG